MTNSHPDSRLEEALALLDEAERRLSHYGSPPGGLASRINEFLVRNAREPVQKLHELPASNFTLHRQPTLVTGGFVGVPREGEKVCGHCMGTGHDPQFPNDRFGGCDICEGTGVRPITEPTGDWAGNNVGDL